MNRLTLVQPAIQPPLDRGFRPAALANQNFLSGCAGEGVPLILGLERAPGIVSHFSTRVFPEGHPRAVENLPFAERLLKFLLWQRGGYRVYVNGPGSIVSHLKQCYSPAGARHFDAEFLGQQVYEQPFSIVHCPPADFPAAREAGRLLGRHLDGCRIGFDLGASDRKVSAVIDGTAVYSEEKIWQPRQQADPAYHYEEILSALHSAAVHLPRVDAIGGSSAGIIINNRPMVASLFRSVPPELYPEVHTLFHRLQAEMGVPLEVINDGDVTALAGSMSLEDNGILGIALGSSQAAGYVDLDGQILGWLNELAFAPVDYSPSAPIDEWSGDIGCGSQYLSQQCVFRLAKSAGISIPAHLPDAGKLEFVQKMLAAGHDGATQIWQSMGVYLGYALAHYASFYEIRQVLILGRCTSGLGGSLILEWANQVLKTEFPDLAIQMKVRLPDERSRRVGQSIAAASLPAVGH